MAYVAALKNKNFKPLDTDKFKNQEMVELHSVSWRIERKYDQYAAVFTGHPNVRPVTFTINALQPCVVDLYDSLLNHNYLGQTIFQMFRPDDVNPKTTGQKKPEPFLTITLDNLVIVTGLKAVTGDISDDLSGSSAVTDKYIATHELLEVEVTASHFEVSDKSGKRAQYDWQEK
jgi:hypothetical protein